MWIRVVSRWLYIPAWDSRCSATEIRIIIRDVCFSLFVHFVMARADYLRDGPSFPIEQNRPDRAVFASVSARFLG